MKTLLILGIFHLWGDFYTQSKNMAENKKTHAKPFIAHAILYALFMGAVFACTPFVNAIISWAIISVTHLIIDKCRIIYERKHEKKKLISFVADQALHLLIIFGCFVLFMRGKPGVIHQYLYGLRWFRDALVYITVLSIIIQPVAILVSKVFESREKEENQGKGTSDPGAGTLIGIMERIIVVALVWLNATSAIGFVLTAKSIARVKQLTGTDDNFAERYLIGTLVSVGMALGVVFLIPKLI